jgi:hypothetical protein
MSEAYCKCNHPGAGGPKSRAMDRGYGWVMVAIGALMTCVAT